MNNISNRLRIFSAGLASVLLLSLAMLNPSLGQNLNPTALGSNGAAGQATSPQSPSRVLLSDDEDYEISPGDVLDIQVEDAPELSKKYTVTASGTFLMPYLGRVAAHNKTPEELANFITEGLRGRYLKSPNVSVFVQQYNSQTFYLQGSVRSPGAYQIERRPTMLKLLIMAGGLAENHGSTAYIIRQKKPTKAEASQDLDPAAVEAKKAAETETANSGEAGEEPLEQYEMIKVNISGLLKGRFEQNIPIQANDIINIPPTDIFFVSGEVHNPGSFPLKEGTTLRQAITLARGTTFKASAGKTLIFRDDLSTGKRLELQVDLDDVMKGKKDDIPLMANDLILVPSSKMKSIVPFITGFGLRGGITPLPY